ncbi:hypothetical protein PNEG_00651 [Pneumocystis murina B123]|uniref:NADH dehydrogenase [ubiquinone] 1 beta subcomplex subunit 4 n=1 Tax=Pneumocystis murina (strain B123) TaxID=1069680 RepID=M7NUR9_PNEMU|nr:hypothetical protein PNEG_00651 [Pneumocystis murina B123]EMR11052.1 hypothetical protein PNEG_00651 [Pneumocystis murina B123]
MRASQHTYFKWTPKTVVASLVLGIFVPSCIGYLALITEGRWNFRGKGIKDKLTEN